MSDKIKQAMYDGDLPLGDIKISCAVLDDGQRVLVQRSTALALGVRGGGAYWTRKRKNKTGALLPEYVSAKYLQEFINDEIRTKLLQTITYINKKGEVAEALPAENLAEICDIWIQADKNGAVPESGKNAAKVAYIVMKSLAGVGIIALVDEATGYQAYRAKDALAKILEAFISKELIKWVKTFPDDFYKEMFRLKGWRFNPLSVKRPSVVGHLTNNLVYERLAPGVLEELKTKTPKDEHGRRKHRYFQWLTDDIGNPKLKEHLAAVVALMKASTKWDDFQRMINRALPKQTELPLFDQKPNQEPNQSPG
jgi:hypothetical protein